MAKKPATPYSFGPGCVQDENTVRLTAQIDQLSDSGNTDAEIMKISLSDSTWSRFDTPWTAIRVWVTDQPELCILGPGGEFRSLTAAGRHEELIDNTLSGPQGRGPVRDMRWIGEHLYVVGMSRQVYRRDEKKGWSHRDEGTVLPLGSKTVAGFNSIDGLTERDFFAVGFVGEIWRCKNGKWKQLESPTNVVLNCVIVVPDGTAYACGQEGVLLRGQGDDWEQMEQNGFEDDLWDLAWFQDELYAAYEDGLLTLSKNDELKPVKLNLRGKVSCRYLDARAGILLSSGPKHIIWTPDGKNWTNITP